MFVRPSSARRLSVTLSIGLFLDSENEETNAFLSKTRKSGSKRDKIPDLSQFDIIILILRNRSSGTIYTEGPKGPPRPAGVI